MKKFGIFNGRLQPFHMGHQAIINEILLDGLTPIIVLGSSNENRDRDKNPLSFSQRKQLIRQVYPNTHMIFVFGEDYSNWDEWYDNLITAIEKEMYRNYDRHIDLKEECVIYYNEKEVDRTDFVFRNEMYCNTWYTDIFRNEGFDRQEVKFVKREDIKINSNARDIRHNLEEMKHLLDARVYFKLKEWGW